MDRDYIKLEHKDSSLNDLVVVDWIMSNICNYACSYCPDTLHNGTIGFPDFEVVKSFCTQVVNHYSPKKVHFQLSGGEVTHCPYFLELLQFLRQIGARVGFLSNGSKPIKWWQKINGYFDQVGLSFHTESAKVSHFLEVVQLVHQNATTHVSLMMKPEKFDECIQAGKDIAALGDVSLSFEPLLVNFSSTLYPYSETQKIFFESGINEITKNIKYTRQLKFCRSTMVKVDPEGKRQEQASNQFLSQGTANWKDWFCHIGLEQFVVRPNGFVTRGWCGVGGSFGHINQKNIKFPEQTVTCVKDFCFCNFDIMCTKTSNSATTQTLTENS